MTTPAIINQVNIAQYLGVHATIWQDDEMGYTERFEYLNILADYAEDRRIFVASINGMQGDKPIGMAAVLLDTLDDGTVIGYLENIFVNHHYRHVGTAFELLQTVLNQVETDQFVLHTAVDNDPMQRLATKLGFQQVATVLNYYDNDDHAYCFVRNKPD